MTVIATRYPGNDDNTPTGTKIAASGRYVVAIDNSAPGYTLWLWKYDVDGVLQRLVVPYNDTANNGYRDSIACWYNEAAARLEIAMGRESYDNPTRRCGAIFFYDWPDSGTQASDMVTRGIVSADVGDQYDSQYMGDGVALCDGRAIAISRLGDHLYMSRTGDTWSADKFQDNSYGTVDNPAPVQLTEHPTIAGCVMGVIGIVGNGADGEIHVVKSTGPGNTWTTPAILYGGVGSASGWNAGRACGIGPGANGNLSIASTFEYNPEGVAIWDRDGDDDTSWIYRGWSKFEQRTIPYALSVGYNLVCGGNNTFWGAMQRVGPINAVPYVNGAWDKVADPPTEFAWRMAPPDSHTNEDSHYDTGCSAIAYPLQGMVRALCGSPGYNPTYPTGNYLGGLTEYNGDLDWPMPPSDPPTITPVSPADGAIGVAKDAPIIWVLSDPQQDIVLSTLVVRVRGVVVVSGGVLLDPTRWAYLCYEYLGGYRCALTPLDRTRYHLFDANEVAVDVADEESQAASRSWTFYRGRVLERIFPMLIDSIERDRN